MFNIEPMYSSEDVRRTADSTGSFYFSENTMRAFDSRLLSGFWPINEERNTGYVVVSNRDKYNDMPREYRVVGVYPYTKPSEHVGLDCMSIGDAWVSAAAAKKEAARLATEKVHPKTAWEVGLGT